MSSLIGASEHGREAARPYSEAAENVVALIATGMLDADPEAEALKISAKGERLLEILPTECDDPDWRLRLSDANGFIPLAKRSLVEEWISTFFAKTAGSEVLAGLRTSQIG